MNNSNLLIIVGTFFAVCVAPRMIYGVVKGVGFPGANALILAVATAMIVAGVLQ